MASIPSEKLLNLQKQEQFADDDGMPNNSARVRISFRLQLKNSWEEDIKPRGLNFFILWHGILVRAWVWFVFALTWNDAFLIGCHTTYHEVSVILTIIFKHKAESWQLIQQPNRLSPKAEILYQELRVTLSKLQLIFGKSRLCKTLQKVQQSFWLSYGFGELEGEPP